MKTRQGRAAEGVTVRSCFAEGIMAWDGQNRWANTHTALCAQIEESADMLETVLAVIVALHHVAARVARRDRARQRIFNLLTLLVRSSH